MPAALLVLLPGWLAWAFLWPRLRRRAVSQATHPADVGTSAGLTLSAIAASQAAFVALSALLVGWSQLEIILALLCRLTFDLVIGGLTLGSLVRTPVESYERPLPELDHSTTKSFVERLPLRSNDITRFVDVWKIEWAEAENQYARVHTADQDYLVSMALGTLVQRLNPAMFCRVHRSALVNLRAVRTLRAEKGGGLTAVLESGSEVPVARGNRRELEHLVSLLPGDSGPSREQLP